MINDHVSRAAAPHGLAYAPDPSSQSVCTLGGNLAFNSGGALMYDAMPCDRTLFTDATGLEQLWNASQRLLDDPPPLQRYAPGSWGPDAMHYLIAPRRWRLPTL